jgi:RNA polymerase sigma-70 factor (ECF subfamily)
MTGMTGPSQQTNQFRHWLERMRGGDLAARDELLRAYSGRLERLARKMLRGYPAVRRWVETGDVLQNSLLRLLRALGEVSPASEREFFSLAGEQMRRELLDLGRHFYGPQGQGANHASHAHLPSGGEPPEPADRAEEASELERWRSFHEEVARLPAEEREVVGLVFYHGWTQAQVAELLGLSERTVRRRWEAALARLHGRLDETP